jgi:hypothetical protein
VLKTGGTELVFEFVKFAKRYDFDDYVDILRRPEVC